MRRALLVLGAAILLLGLALGGLEAHSHATIRGDYERESARLTDGGAYDAARSDALYDELLEHRSRAKWAGWLAALGWIVLGLLLFRAGPALELHSATARRALFMNAVDAIAVGLVVLGSAVAEPSLGAGLAGWGALFTPQLRGLALSLAWGTMSSGAGLGARLANVRVTAGSAPPGLWRGLAALALWPFTLAWTPVALAFALARPARPPSSAVPHLSWVGLTVRATAPRKS